MSLATSDTSLSSLLEGAEEVEQRLPVCQQQQQQVAPRPPPAAKQAELMRWAANDSLQAASKFMEDASEPGASDGADSLHVPGLELRLEVAISTVVSRRIESMLGEQGSSDALPSPRVSLC